MTLQEKFFETDPRILVLDDISQFSLCRKFYAGILCPYNPLSSDDEKEIADFTMDGIRKGAVNVNLTDNGSGYVSYIYDKHPTPLRMPKALAKACGELNKVFNDIMGVHPNDSLLRINSSIPEEFHDHEDTLSYTFLGSTTEVMRPDGYIYSVPERHIMYMTIDIMHRAPQDSTIEYPRLFAGVSHNWFN